MINQDTTVGSTKYVRTGTDPYGNPLYTLKAQLSPEQQKLYDQTVANKAQYGQTAGTIAGTGKTLADTSAPMYSDANTIMNNVFSGADSLTKYRVQQALAFQDPFNKQDLSWRDTQLRNQGIMPGTKAYDAQMNRLQSQQSLNQQNFISNVLPESMNEAITAYNLPLQTQQQLAALSTGFNTAGASDAINQMQTPQFTAKPSDFTTPYGASLNSQNANYQNQIAGYNAKLQSQSNMMNGIFGMAGAGLKLFI